MEAKKEKKCCFIPDKLLCAVCGQTVRKPCVHCMRWYRFVMCPTLLTKNAKKYCHSHCAEREKNKKCQ
uniref:Uncharacterized protein n=1 Tax=Anopheles gambiae TaxID=7165 RepID=A0A903XYY7_ANOGA